MLSYWLGVCGGQLEANYATQNWKETTKLIKNNTIRLVKQTLYDFNGKVHMASQSDSGVTQAESMTYK